MGSKMRIRKTILEVIQAEVSAIDVDAVVILASPDLKMTRGVARRLADRGGPRLVAEAIKQAPVAFGEAVVTTGGTLLARNVIHTAGFDEKGATNQVLLREAMARAISLADAMQFKSVAFSALGCDRGEMDPVGGAKILLQEIFKVCQHSQTGLEKIIICSESNEQFKIYDRTIRGYLRHLQEDLGPGPYVTVDIIIEMPVPGTAGDDGIVIIERSNPPYGLALPGGFLDYGESLEETACREAREETALELDDLRQFHTYSAMGRDPRFQTVSTVFIARGRGQAQSGDDAKSLRVIPRAELLGYDYAFDHKEVIRDYLAARVRPVS